MSELQNKHQLAWVARILLMDNFMWAKYDTVSLIGLIQVFIGERTVAQNYNHELPAQLCSCCGTYAMAPAIHVHGSITTDCNYCINPEFANLNHMKKFQVIKWLFDFLTTKELAHLQFCMIDIVDSWQTAPRKLHDNNRNSNKPIIRNRIQGGFAASTSVDRDNWGSNTGRSKGEKVKKVQGNEEISGQRPVDVNSAIAKLKALSNGK
jgi:hypothetical protein